MIAGLDAVSLVGWVVIFVAGTIWEFRGIIRKGRGDTLSETVWRLYRTGKIWLYLGSAFLLWLVVHFATFGRWG